MEEIFENIPRSRPLPLKYAWRVPKNWREKENVQCRLSFKHSKYSKMSVFPLSFSPQIDFRANLGGRRWKLRNTSCGSFSPSPSFLPDISTLNKDNPPFLNINYLTAHSEKNHCPSLTTAVRDEIELHGDQSSGVSSPIDGEIDPSHFRRGVFSCVFCEYIEAVQSAIWLF